MSNRYLFDTALRTIEIREIAGFAMYAMEHYPYVVYTGNPYDRIIVEFTFVSDSVSIQSICSFEAEAGYQLQEIPFGSGSAWIFVFPKAGPEPRILHGDWSLYRKI